MRHPVLLSSLLLASASGCGPRPPCDAATCAGGCCTASGACVTPSEAACGASGQACVACASGQSCDRGACATVVDAGSADRYPDGGSPYAFWDGGACTVKTDCPCFSSDDCGPGFSCQSEDATGANVFCKPGKRGDGGVGAPCAGEADCLSALCTDSNSGAYCSALCSGDQDCPAVLPRCLFIGFGIDRALCSPP